MNNSLGYPGVSIMAKGDRSSTLQRARQVPDGKGLFGFKLALELQRQA
jgi:hypothetical protein